MFVRFARSALVLAVLAVFATACAGDGSSDTGADPTAEPSYGTPAPEGTGHEPPAPGGAKKPDVETAGGALGMRPSPNSDGTVCLEVLWMGEQGGAHLGEGAVFQVTEIHLSGAEPAGFPCGGEPCQGFTFNNDTDKCTYAVRPGATAGALALDGRVICSAPPEVCERFRSNLKVLPVPVPAAQPSGTPTPSDGPTPSESPTPSPSPTPDDGPTDPESPGSGEQTPPGE
jgi:hypothetical protein